MILPKTDQSIAYRYQLETQLHNPQYRSYPSLDFQSVHMLSLQKLIDPTSTLICTLSLCPAPLFKDADQDDIHTAKRFMPSMLDTAYHILRTLTREVFVPASCWQYCKKSCSLSQPSLMNHTRSPRARVPLPVLHFQRDQFAIHDNQDTSLVFFRSCLRG